MTCKFESNKDGNSFKCSNVGRFYYLNNGTIDPDKDSPLDPYSRYECDHHSKFEYHGVLTCSDCGATYDENSLSWVGGKE
jgi:hypothetical protein